MENKEIKESFDILLTVCRIDDNKLDIAYKQMRDLLERLCRSQMQNESLQMTDLSARISFVAARTGLSAVEQNRLHTFRLTSLDSLRTELEAMELGPLFGLWLQSFLIQLTMIALNIVIFVIVYGRMIEIYCASRSAAFHPKAVCGHFGNPALASR